MQPIVGDGRGREADRSDGVGPNEFLLEVDDGDVRAGEAAKDIKLIALIL